MSGLLLDLAPWIINGALVAGAVWNLLNAD